MKLVIQVVKRAGVTVGDRTVGQIGKGYLVLVGVAAGDTEETVDRYLAKMLKLRIFQDENGKTNLSLSDVGGALLLVSQFTLLADCRDGNRPSFTKAGDPAHAKSLYEYMIRQARKSVPQVEQGEFGADMQVELINDGPFTIILDETNVKQP